MHHNARPWPKLLLLLPACLPACLQTLEHQHVRIIIRHIVIPHIRNAAGGRRSSPPLLQQPYTST
jgi:hypothetical protein